MKQRTFKLTAALLVLAGLNSLKAQDAQPINVVTTAVPFLRISPDARAGGMGDLGVATSPDANSAFWNLAKTPFAQKNFSIGLTYTPWLKDLGLNDVYLLALAGYYKLDDLQAFSGSVRYFSLGNIQFTNPNGDYWGDGRPREFGVDLGYSRKLSDKIGLGVALRYINSNLAAGAPSTGTAYKAGSTVAGDLSFYYNGLRESGSGWSFGAVLSNLGGKIGYTNDAQQRDYIPANLSFGTTYTAAIDETNKIQFGVDFHKLLVPTPPAFTGNTSEDSALVVKYRDKSVMSSWFSSFGDAPGGFSEELKELQVSLGAEYSYNDQFFVRAGYFYEDKSKGNRKYFTVGLGLKYNVFGLNFSYLVPSGSGVNRNPLSNTLRFGLIFDLDDAGGDN
ncbi:type IX secretion system outer membrane channel protein PorV [Paraflavitalea sp. CAU 1676]|uniref:type IX secretion system outer membrane channel protein PorV n=1 Tax=Paraflavitalea sp. CAU 1676 TaxID=3032598 RepID=UPI0023DCA165|nr:type IX secretion system outer membrane channel protein PorV [Paraflavitalea sp. CAU 1676]MDF2193062.1 type IX secretion system outer membrane channel protein PorV [Paraflavitalea sp. CAU 1676]